MQERTISASKSDQSRVVPVAGCEEKLQNQAWAQDGEGPSSPVDKGDHKGQSD